MADQLDIFGSATPLDQLEPREVRAGERGGAMQAASIPDEPERYVQILTCLRRYTHADFELAAAHPGVHPGTISKRRLRLERAGLLEKVPDVTRKTYHGVEAMVFRITNQGLEVLTQWEQQHPTSSGRSPRPGEGPTSTSSMPSGPLPVSGPSSRGT